MISVIVAVYNKQDTIAECITSILNQTKQDFELILVDDGSSDESRSIIQKYSDDPRIKIVETSHVGYANAKNRGVEKASGEILYFIDADCVASPGSLNEMAHKFDESDVGCIGGVLKALNSEHLIPRVIEVIQNDLVESRWPPGANVSYRKDVFEKAAGFSDEIEVGEDVDLFLKVHKLGFKLLMDPKLIVRTVHPYSIIDLCKQRFRWGIGRAQVRESHPEIMSIKEVHQSLILNFLALMSLFLSIIDLKFVFVLVLLIALNILRFALSSINIAKRSGVNNFSFVITLIEFFTANAQFLGYYYWRLLELIGKRKPLKHWSP